MMPAFETPTGLPLSMVNLAKRVGVPDKDNRGLVSTAEVSTLQLELKYLTMLTDDKIYWDKAETVCAQWVPRLSFLAEVPLFQGHEGHQKR